MVVTFISFSYNNVLTQNNYRDLKTGLNSYNKVRWDTKGSVYPYYLNQFAWRSNGKRGHLNANNASLHRKTLCGHITTLGQSRAACGGGESV